METVVELKDKLSIERVRVAAIRGVREPVCFAQMSQHLRALHQGGDMRRVVVMRVGKKLHLVDGSAQLAAADALGIEEIEATVLVVHPDNEKGWRRGLRRKARQAAATRAAAPLVSLEPAGDLVRVRRYVRQSEGPALCTHAGLYDPNTVHADGVDAYRVRGANQDRRTA